MGLTEILALIIPILLICLAFGVPALAIYLDYKTKIAMIEKGIKPDDEKHKPGDIIAWGIATLGIGITLSIGWMFNYNELTMAGLVLASIGIALLVSYLIKKKSK